MCDQILVLEIYPRFGVYTPILLIADKSTQVLKLIRGDLRERRMDIIYSVILNDLRIILREPQEV